MNFTLHDLILQAPLAAGALWLVYMFTAGKLHTDGEFQRTIKERDEYKRTLETERKIATELAQTGSVTNQLLGAVVSLSAEKAGIPLPRIVKASPEDVTHE